MKHKPLTKKQIEKITEEFMEKTTNKVAFSLDLAKLATEIGILEMKYGKFAVKLALDSAYHAWNIEEFEKEWEEDLEKYV